MLAQRAQLALLDEECGSITRLLQKVEDDNIDIALLGRFSSGKSSIINALLGVPIDDRNPRLLPTDVRPETATVNRVCYDAKERVKVELLRRAELMFATTTSDPGQLRLHGDEIRSFGTWLSTGLVKAKDVTFTFLPEEFRDRGHTQQPRPADQMAAFHRVWRDLGFPDEAPMFVYAAEDPRAPKLPDLRFPATAIVGRLPSAANRVPRNISRDKISPG